MSGACCNTCAYSVCDPEAWLRSRRFGESIVPRCANHPLWQGRVHDVPGVACVNYQQKPMPPKDDSVRLIALSGGGYAWVDAADYEWLNRYHWRSLNGYPCRSDKRRRVFMHRQIMQPPAEKVVDHIDGNKRNACRSNLRICTCQENRHNQRKRRNGSSRFKGVTFDKRLGRWKAQYRLDGRTYHIGCFDDEVEAARAYDYAAVKCFGEFACLNLPREWPPERRTKVREEYLQAETRQ